MQRYRDANDNSFAEPAPLRANVQGGYGLFGGASDVVGRIKLEKTSKAVRESACAASVSAQSVESVKSAVMIR